jgi:hypothetical protein
MAIYAVARHDYVHTCPANTEPHPVATIQHILNVVPGRPCQSPVTIRIGNHTALISCGRHNPHDRQCAGCATVVTTLSITTTDLGYQGPANRAPSNEESA